MLTNYTLLAGFAVRWYLRASGRLLLRHWQWLLIAGFFIPGDILAVPSGALVAIVSPAHGPIWHLAAIGGAQLLALLWILPQRDILTGGEFARYAATLPIAQIVRRSAYFTLLLVADTLILLPVQAAMANRLMATDGAKVDQFLALWILLGATLILQMAVLKKRALLLGAVGAVDLSLGLGLAYPGFGYALLPAAAAFAVAGFFTPERLRLRDAFVAPHVRPRLVRGLRGPIRPLVAALKIQWQILSARPLASAARLSLALALALGTDRLINIFGFDARAIPTLTAALALTALILSGLYRTLRDAHAPTRTFLASLPVSRHYWAWRDTLLVMLLGLAPLAILLPSADFHRLIPGLALLGLAGAYLVLVASLRLPLLFGGGLSVMLGFLLATGWAGATMAAVLR
jgi:hypothetical protein